MLEALRVIHVVNAVLMAWPFYALVAVNNRARLGPPLGDRTDLYLERMIKNRTIPCFVFQATALLSGLALVWLRSGGLAPLLTTWVLTVKFLLLLLIAGVLTYVHLQVQPRLDALFAGAGSPVGAETAAQIQALRLRRKRLASVCLFAVLTMVVLGVQVGATVPGWLTVVFILAVAAFTVRAFRSVTPYGWA